jgi:hypothetical protein
VAQRVGGSTLASGLSTSLLSPQKKAQNSKKSYNFSLSVFLLPPITSYLPLVTFPVTTESRSAHVEGPLVSPFQLSASQISDFASPATRHLLRTALSVFPSSHFYFYLLTSVQF